MFTVFAALACSRNTEPEAAPEAAPRAAPAPVDDREARYEDLTAFVGKWPVRSGTSACAGPRGFELVADATARAGYHLIDAMATRIDYEVTGSRRGEDGVLTLALRADPTAEVKKVDLVLSESGEWAKVTWTQPPAEPFELITPHGVQYVPSVPEPCH
ncbi:MAG: hypothetical protein ABMA64_09015 [Myxococcota bacterium]